MKLFELNNSNPTQLIETDNTILSDMDSGKYEHNILRLWEASSYFIVLGASNKPETEVNISSCRQDNIPILKRRTGGGTVLQGPGCFNYAFICSLKNRDDLKTIQAANRSFMKTVSSIIKTLGISSTVQGVTDLTVGNKKFSGNAQKRTRNAVLFHGTILYSMDISKIETYLTYPSKAPDYRTKRSHRDFLTNIPVTYSELKEAFLNALT